MKTLKYIALLISLAIISIDYYLIASPEVVLNLTGGEIVAQVSLSAKSSLVATTYRKPYRTGDGISLDLDAYVYILKTNDGFGILKLALGYGRAIRSVTRDYHRNRYIVPKVTQISDHEVVEFFSIDDNGKLEHLPILHSDLNFLGIITTHDGIIAFSTHRLWKLSNEGMWIPVALNEMILSKGEGIRSLFQLESTKYLMFTNKTIVWLENLEIASPVIVPLRRHYMAGTAKTAIWGATHESGVHSLYKTGIMDNVEKLVFENKRDLTP
jgi:hypothetical protein